MSVCEIAPLIQAICVAVFSIALLLGYHTGLRNSTPLRIYREGYLFI